MIDRVVLVALACAGFVAGARGVAAQQAPVETCLTCHGAMGDSRLKDPVDLFASDVHATQGFGCTSCHGGDPTAMGMQAMDSTSGFIGKPLPADVPRVCGRCHSDADFMKRFNPNIRVDQVARYETSIHGHRLAEQGDTNVAVCSNCHRVHAIRRPSDPLSEVYRLNIPATCGECHSSSEHMASYEIGTTQVTDYEQSVHWENLSQGGDMGAAVCTDCHSNHGAAPPGVDWVGNACGQCHGVIARNFAGSTHARLFPYMGRPGCPGCHSNHAIQRVSDEWIGLDEGDLCKTCHVAETPSGAAVLTIRALLDSLRTGMDSAAAILDRAEAAGMEVGESQVNLNSANTALLNARAAFHSLKVDSVAAYVSAGIEVTNAGLEDGLGAFRELRNRRIWLGASVPILILAIVGLLLKIRQLEAGSEVELLEKH